MKKIALTGRRRRRGDVALIKGECTWWNPKKGCMRRRSGGKCINDDYLPSLGLSCPEITKRCNGCYRESICNESRKREAHIGMSNAESYAVPNCWHKGKDGIMIIGM